MALTRRRGRTPRARHGFKSRGRRASRDQMLRRGRLGLAGQKPAPLSQPSFGGEESLPHARQDRQASSVSRPLEGRQRPKKPGPSLLQVASPVWRGAPVRLRLPVFPRAVDWPLVQIPADRHTTTGTCVLGEMVICANRLQTQAVFSPHGGFLGADARESQTTRPPAAGQERSPRRLRANAGAAATTRASIRRPSAQSRHHTIRNKYEVIVPISRRLFHQFASISHVKIGNTQVFAP